MSSLLNSFLILYPKLLTRARYALAGSAGEAEDLLQDLYVKLAQRSSQETIAHPQAYLQRAADHLARDRKRAGRRNTAVPLTEETDPADPGPSVEATIDGRRRLELLGSAVAGLPPRQREALRLARMEGLSYAEIARRMGISESAVEKLLAKALKRCRSALAVLEEQ